MNNWSASYIVIYCLNTDMYCLESTVKIKMYKILLFYCFSMQYSIYTLRGQTSGIYLTKEKCLTSWRMVDCRGVHQGDGWLQGRTSGGWLTAGAYIRGVWITQKNGLTNEHVPITKITGICDSKSIFNI